MGTFTETEKTDIRRHMGYPMFGNTPTQDFGHRFTTHYGTLEYRLNHGSPTEEAVVRTWLTTLNLLESDIDGVRTNLDTAAAAVWTRNPDEHMDREMLYRSKRMRLCQFFGLPPGPAVGGANVRLVV